MRKILLPIVLAATALASPAYAQFKLEISNVDPLTKLPAKDWVQFVTRIVNPAPIVGKDAVYMVNATGEDLQAVTCQKWYLVGENPYLSGNVTTGVPRSLPKWSITLVPTEKFDGYCGKGLDASGVTLNYHGNLNAADKSLSRSTFVVFMEPDK